MKLEQAARKAIECIVDGEIGKAELALREALSGVDMSPTEQTNMNLNCKSVQARLATSWGYVKAEQAEQEPDYFGLTHDHTWLSIDKKQYDKLKPEGRMACYAAPQPVSQEPVAWIEGYPKDFYSEEWFIAITIYGDRVVLKALPENYSYDFTTADGTYMKKENVKRWMQFPDSEFLPPTVAAPVRTKDLTDEELWEAAKTAKSNDLTDAFRAVIAADREKNK